MHDCFRISEILDQILTCVLEEQPGIKGKNNVISVALTCRAVVEVALDVAWKNQTSLVPVIKTLPQECWKDGNPKDKKPYNFDRKFVLLVDRLSSDEEERFMFYAKRIRRLEYFPFAFHQLAEDKRPTDLKIIQTIDTIRSNKHQPLFPNLQQLIFAVVDHAACSLAVFLQTKGVSLSLDWNSPQDSTDRLFPIINEYALNMQELDLGDCKELEPPRNENTALSELVCKMKDLRALSCGPRLLNAKAILHLSSLPYLRKLRVPNNSQDILNGLLLHQQTVGKDSLILKPPFPELNELVLRETGKLSFASLMKQLRPAHIQKLVIQLSGHIGPPPSRDILDTFVALAEDSSAPGNVHSIVFKSIINTPTGHSEDDEITQLRRMFDIQHSTTIVDGNTLEPLLSLRNLTVLDLDLLCKFSLGDTQIQAMADAWPRLRRLKLGSLLGWCEPSGVTYDGLLYLLLRCPELEDLALAFDAASTIPSVLIITPAHVNRNITYLYIGDSMIGANNPDMIGKFLAAVFPRCNGITGKWLMQDGNTANGGGGDGTSSFLEWHRVLVALKKYQALNSTETKK